MVRQDEYYAMKQQLRAYEEQNQKLQGTIRHLQAVNESLQIDKQKLEAQKKDLKDAFDDMFLKNIGNAWDHYDEKIKESLNKDIKKKVDFFNKEVNLTKVQIREKMKRKYGEEIQTLTKEVERLKKVEKEFAAYKENSTQGMNLKEEKKFDGGSDVIDSFMKKAKSSESESSERKEPVKDKRTNDGTSRFGSIFDTKKTPKNPEKEEEGQKKEFLKEKEKNLNQNESVKKSFTGNNSKPQNQYQSKNQGQKYSNQSPSNNSQKPPVSKFNNNSTNSSSSTETNNATSISAQEKEILNYIGKWKEINTDMRAKINKKINEMAQGLSALEREYIKIIAKTGLFLNKDIISEAKKLGLDDMEGKIYNIQKRLLEVGFITQGEEIKQISGRPVQPILLTNEGFWLYVFLTKENPVKSMLEIMSKEQKSVDHGFHIHQLVDLFKAAGYICSQEDIKLTSEGEASICDIRASRDNKLFRIEYEEGNYPKAGYFEKFKRILDIDNFLIFIGVNVEARDKIKKYFDEFVITKMGGYEKLKSKGKTFIFLTLSDVKKDPDAIAKHWKKFLREQNYG